MAELREAIEAAMNTETVTAEKPKNETEIYTQVQEDAVPAVPESAEPTTTVEPQPKGETSAKPETTPETPNKAETPAEAEARVARSRVDRPPQSWKEAGKGEWSALPLHVRQEIHRRESQINKVLEESSTYKEISSSFEKLFTPHLQRVRDYGTNPVQMVDSLLQTEAALASGSQFQKAETIANLIQQYGIDVQTLDEVLSKSLNRAPQQVDPTAELEQRLMQRLSPALQTVQDLQRQIQQREQAMQQEVEHTVESMALDPKYPYFDTVREDMADIIEMAQKRGVTISLEQAYHRAVRMNDDIYRDTSIQQQASAASKAKAAAVSVGSNPGFSGASVNQGDGSLRSAIEAAFGANRI